MPWAVRPLPSRPAHLQELAEALPVRLSHEEIQVSRKLLHRQPHPGVQGGAARDQAPRGAEERVHAAHAVQVDRDERGRGWAARCAARRQACGAGAAARDAASHAFPTWLGRGRIDELCGACARGPLRPSAPSRVAAWRLPRFPPPPEPWRAAACRRRRPPLRPALRRRLGWEPRGQPHHQPLQSGRWDLRTCQPSF